MLCYVCPHRCGVDRPDSINDTNGMFGCCGVGILPVVSRATATEHAISIIDAVGAVNTAAVRANIT